MTQKKGDLTAIKVVGPQHELMIMSKEGAVIRVKTPDISQLGRNTQGVKIMNVADGDKVSSVARMVAKKPKAKTKVNENQGALDLGV
jgi:DNA gyrase subunit A